jgi:hypothetical protein
MSDGMRSGVNWMRLKLRPSVLALLVGVAGLAQTLLI